MLRWLLVLFFAVGWTTARADTLMDSTTRAWNSSAAAEQNLERLKTQWTTLNAKFRAEQAEVTRLKNGPQGWNTRRKLEAKLAEAQATGDQLATLTSDVQKATTQLATARRALVAAIDAELAANPSGPRRTQLDKARAQVMPTARKVHRIVMPDMKIDPLADPEELDQQADAIKATEAELQNQIKGLEAQAKELDRIALLRKQHDRTKELDNRDDNASRKGPTPNSRGGVGDAAAETAPPPNGPTNGGGGTDRPDTATFEADAQITLADVVDPNTIQALDRAQRSNDPAKRASAARLTRDAVAKRLQQLRDQRKQVETRAAQLRKR